MQAGISTLGIKVSYGFETVTSGNNEARKPTSFTVLHRINSIGGIQGETNNVDASALEDYMERMIAGRQSSGGNFPITYNSTDETDEEWDALITAYKTNATSGKRMWVQVSSPYMTKAWFIACQPPQVIPMPSFDQNGLLTNEMSMVIDEYIGKSAKVTPTDSEATS